MFIVTSAFLFFMAIKFIGEAMQEFQEQQYISYTVVRGGEWLLQIGFNPTWEAVIAQLVVVVLAILTVTVFARRAAAPKRPRSDLSGDERKCPARSRA